MYVCTKLIIKCIFHISKLKLYNEIINFKKKNQDGHLTLVITGGGSLMGLASSTVVWSSVPPTYEAAEPSFDLFMESQAFLTSGDRMLHKAGAAVQKPLFLDPAR